MATSSIGSTMGALATLVVLLLIIGLPLYFAFTSHSPKNPTFSVESSTIKAYNLTSSNEENQLFCIINLGVRVGNPNTRKYSYSFKNIEIEVRKGHHHKLADDAQWGFRVGPGGDILVNVEAVGLHVGLERKIADEVRADVVAGEGRVNLFMTGYVGYDILGVTCKNVAIDVVRSTVRVQKVVCKVSVTDPDSGGG